MQCIDIRHKDLIRPSLSLSIADCLQGSHNCVCVQLLLNLIACGCPLGTTPTGMTCIGKWNIWSTTVLYEDTCHTCQDPRSFPQRTKFAAEYNSNNIVCYCTCREAFMSGVYFMLEKCIGYFCNVLPWNRNRPYGKRSPTEMIKVNWQRVSPIQSIYAVCSAL